MVSSALLILLFQLTRVDAAIEPVADPDAVTVPPYLRVSVDRVTIDTQGLIQASENLSNAIGRLAVSIEQLSTNSDALSEQDREMMLNAVKSVDAAGHAFRELAQGIPRAAQDFGERSAIEARQRLAGRRGDNPEAEFHFFHGREAFTARLVEVVYR